MVDKSPTVISRNWGYQQKLWILKHGYMSKSLRENERLLSQDLPQADDISPHRQSPEHFSHCYPGVTPVCRAYGQPGVAAGQTASATAKIIYVKVLNV